MVPFATESACPGHEVENTVPLAVADASHHSFQRGTIAQLSFLQDPAPQDHVEELKPRPARPLARSSQEAARCVFRVEWRAVDRYQRRRLSHPDSQEGTLHRVHTPDIPSWKECA